jgi:hypothetical protein
MIPEPKSSFEIAFNMFDMDGNRTVDKREFLVVINTKILPVDFRILRRKPSQKSITSRFFEN